MICSQARIEANRRNAARSTGPKTEEGKARSRANALKHGLCGSIVVPESADDIQARALDLYNAFKPYTGYQAWNIDRAAILQIRIERVERMERRIRDKISLRAELTWDDDRKLEAEVLGGTLAKRPPEVVEMLRRTPQGCDWLMARWALLAHAADTQDGQWTAEQTELAYDLLATPSMFRTGKPGASVDFEGRVIDPADDSAAVARRMVSELKEHRAVVADLDEVDRALMEADLDHETSSELRRLRRYESAMHGRLRWTIKQMQFQGPLDSPDPGCYPTWKVESAPQEQPEASHPDEILAANHPADNPHPPFCLTPDEFPPIGQGADIPKVLDGRKKKRRDRAKARRETAREWSRKLGA
jgi:hypothetical protein